MANLIGPSFKPSARFPMLRAYVTATINPGGLATDTSYETTVTVPSGANGDGAAVGDFVMAAPGTDMTTLQFSASISAANTIRVSIANTTAATVTPASSTWTFLVFYQGDGAGVGI